MLFRGTLVRLAAWYFLLLALVLACFNVIVYFSLSEALNARVSADLQKKARDTVAQLTTNRNGSLASYGPAADPSLADTFVFVIQTNKNGDPTVVENSPLTAGLDYQPSQLPIQAAKLGTRTQQDLTVANNTFRVLTEPIKDKSGNIIGVIQAAKPLSAVSETLNNLERQLAIASGVALLLGALTALLMANKSLRPLRLAFVKQREFVADASHELRTPLTLIRTNAEAWIRRAPEKSADPYARHILEEVDQLNAIVGDLTTLALADARQLRLEPRALHLDRIVRELIDHTTPLAEEGGLTLRTELEPVLVEADPARLRQLLVILLDNAIAHTPSGGEVAVSVVRAGGRARIVVQDTGSGIASHDLPFIFERFFRADKARSRERGGTGLGLAIAKWIVEAHRGTIDVRSEVSRGTQVTVTLPAMSEQPVPQPLPAPA
ncbi:MAG TPA: ATP-binding protein [Candidatus Limnocylindrales bacterium]|nr:ATP-binding protein [Candidatus Limnocylindrales bacterium]